MDHAVIRERTRLIELLLEGRADRDILGIPHAVVFRHGVRDAVLVRPCHGLARRDGNGLRREGEVRDRDGIRARGYQIVPVYQLLGKTRADVMPPLPANERWAARLNFVGFWLFDFTIKAITWIFLIGDVLMTGRLLIIGAFAIFDRLRRRQYGCDVGSYKPEAAVLIPAYNEEKVIERTVRAALASDYPNLRVIVIDDGSKDKTLEVARAARLLHKPVDIDELEAAVKEACAA